MDIWRFFSGHTDPNAHFVSSNVVNKCNESTWPVKFAKDQLIPPWGTLLPPTMIDCDCGKIGQNVKSCRGSQITAFESKPLLDEYILEDKLFAKEWYLAS